MRKGDVTICVGCEKELIPVHAKKEEPKKPFETVKQSSKKEEKVELKNEQIKETKNEPKKQEPTKLQNIKSEPISYRQNLEDVLMIYSYFVKEEATVIAKNQSLSNPEKLKLLKHLVEENNVAKYLN